MNALTQYINLYEEHKDAINSHAPKLLNTSRAAALDILHNSRLPEKGEEKYTVVSLNEMFLIDYGLNINRVDFPFDSAATFHCGVPNISTLMGLVINDTFKPTNTLQRNLPAGVIMMSLANAAEVYPEIVYKYLGKTLPKNNVAGALNTLFLQDGVFIYVPSHTIMQRPLQLVNVFNSLTPIMGVRRILIVIDDYAEASLLICDHSQRQDIKYLSNQVVEIHVGRGAKLEYYDMEESSKETQRLSQIFVEQEAESHLIIGGMTLIGGITRNDYNITVRGDHADTYLAGMAIGDGTQVVDNVTNIVHLSQSSKSTQMLKYVLDDKAQGAFYGTIVVDEKAKHTNAYQTNKNILASKEARMFTRPQLEIYCDDVKCSHGATIGQLDSNALFYMRSRGIPLEEARLMLMQAFMADVVDAVSIPALKIRLQQLIESRLSGKKMLCNNPDC